MLRRLFAPLSRVDAATVSLVLTELVTNAVRHGCAGPETEVRVELFRTLGVVRLEVAQPGPLYQPDAVRRRRPGIDRGWGVLILDRMCRDWGVDTGTGTVWAELTVDEAV